MILLREIAIGIGILVAVTAVLCVVPPVRDWFFGNKLFPFPTPWDVTSRQIEELAVVAEPGDIIVERNWHSAQWMALAKLASGSSWVHTALVEKPGTIINMSHTVRVQPFSTYLEKQSTDMVLLRPSYPDRQAVARALAYARSKIGTEFDPKFEDPAGTCAGLVGAALQEAGIDVPKRPAFGFHKPVYAAVDLFHIPGMQVVWTNRPSIKFNGAKPVLAEKKHKIAL